MPSRDGTTGSFDLQPDDEAERYPIALYRHVATLAPVAGRDVLEIGSGRGGGASYVARYLKPRRMVGIDLSGKAVAFSKQATYHRQPTLSPRRCRTTSLR